MTRENRYDGVHVATEGSLDALPLEFKVQSGGKALFFGLVIAGILGALAWNAPDLFPFHWFGDHRGLAMQIAPVAIGAIAVIVALRAVFERFTRQDVRINQYEVAVTRRTPFGSSAWKEPLSGYRGVRWKRFLLPSNRSTSSQFHLPRYRNVIELAHDDPERQLPLVVYATGRANAAETLALARAAFGNPNPTPEEKAEMEQAAEELARQSRGDHLRDTWESLAEEGKVESNWTYTPPPEPLEVEPSTGGEETILIRATDVPILVWMFITLGGLMLVLGLYNAEMGLMFGGLLFGGMGFFVRFMGRNNPRRLTIANGVLSHEIPNRKQGNFRVSLSAIEGIEIRDASADTAHGQKMKLQGKKLWISSDQGDYTAGAGLKPEALEWLRGYLLDAARKA